MDHHKTDADPKYCAIEYLKLALVIIFFESVVGVVIYRCSSPVDTPGANYIKRESVTRFVTIGSPRGLYIGPKKSSKR